ncbi:MAG: response regulator [Candidatus Heimdallarchaeota archaeon]|nr:response regulator [Candidatus Heimdallarchaeota archaeon]
MSGKKRVLIVDDARFMRLVLRRILTQAGYEIVGEARDGIEAVEMYAEKRPDVMTLDIVMPRLNGIQAVKQIMEFDPQAKIIMVTALGQEAFVLDAIKSGAREFIIKPFKNLEIVKAVKKTIGA